MAKVLNGPARLRVCYLLEDTTRKRQLSKIALNRKKFYNLELLYPVKLKGALVHYR